jgi:rhomboid family GlyGly-CTERM serine protease
MGLGLDQNNASLAILRRISYWRLPAALIFSSGLIELFGDAGRSFLQFDRAAISVAELWRLISGHFVHLGPNHFLLNAFGLVLVWLLVGMHFTLRQWLIVIVVSIAGTDAGLWFLDPQLTWYVGMSGFLHGMLAAGIVKGFQAVPREATIVGVAVLMKIMFEQLIGPLPGSEQSAGGDVVVNAHLYGVLAGAATAAVFWNRDIAKSPI